MLFSHLGDIFTEPNFPQIFTPISDPSVYFLELCDRDGSKMLESKILIVVKVDRD